MGNKGIKALEGRQVKLFKADEEGNPTSEVLLSGKFIGIARDVTHKGSFMEGVDVALVFDGNVIHKTLIEQLNFV